MKPHSLLALAWEVLREPMLLLLVAAGAIYLFLGELRDSAVLLVSIFVVLGISLYQQRKTERALEAHAIFPARELWSSVTVGNSA